MGNNFDFSAIKTLRRKLGMTAVQLAQKAGLTRATVAKIECGEANPTMGTMEALASVFQMSPSELVHVVELDQFEMGKTESIEGEGFVGKFIWFPNFEIYYIQAKANTEKEPVPEHHKNTAEVCMVLSGKVKLTVGRQSYVLEAGMSARFKALQDHYFEVMEDSEFLLIHHNFT